jgi:hypothetical protein
MGEVRKEYLKTEMERAIDLFANEYGDVELVNFINYWMIKKLNKRLELKNVHD